MAKGVNSGTLDRRIDIERKTVSSAPSGQDIETWEKLVSARPAAMYPIRGDERFTAAQFIANQQVDFRIRWSPAVADVNPLDRVIYPTREVSSPDMFGTDVYDIMEVIEEGRRQYLKIRTSRRAESVSS